MPEIKIQHVISSSSADQGNPAENLLKPEGSHKWKTTAPQDKHATVVLQFEKATQIHSIDIGNEGSAFVEVLVGKSTAKTDHDYQVLLVASSFMSPLDSRNGTNRNSVRMFGPDKLSKTTSSEKWDRVKIVCTQPFNKSSSYGLSFIKFHSPPVAGESGDDDKTKGAKKLGAFLIRPEKEDDIASGSVFANRGKEVKKDTPPLTGAAAVRAASRLAEESRPTASSSPKTESTSQKRKHHVSDDEKDDEPITRLPLRKQSTSLSSTASSIKDEKPPMKKSKSEPPKQSSSKIFSKLMEGVVFVLSGFQNPFRGELRDKAMEMGAVYKSDWDKTCTHLICAFHNTPKYNQVKGKGKIVTKEWIQHCYKQKTALPWRKYRLGDADSPSESSSEEEEFIPRKRPPPSKKKHVASKHDSDEETPKPSVMKKESTKKVTPQKQPDQDLYGGDTDSGEDTEDEVRRIKAKMSKNDEKPKSKSTAEEEEDIYDKSTDEDEAKTKGEDGDSDSGLPELPDLFTDKFFFLYGDFTVSERRLLNRYITAYNGELENYMSDKTSYVVTYSKWDDNFDEALSDKPSLVFVKPKWVYTCHEREKFIPYQPYVVVPD